VRDSFLSLVSNGVGRIAGFAGVVVIAAQYGATIETDIFFLILAGILFLTALGQSFFDLWFIPTYLRYKNQSATTQSAFLGSVMGAIASLGTLLSIGSDALVSHAAVMYGNYGSEDAARVLVQLTYEMSPLVVLYWLSGVGIAVLNAEQRFIAAGLMPSISWISTVPLAVYAKHSLGIHALSIGLVIGTSCQIGVLLVLLKRSGIAISLGHHHCAIMMDKFREPASLLLGLAMLSFMPFMDRLLVSYLLPSGNVTALENASRLTQIPWTLAAVGYMNVYHSWWVKKASEGDIQSLSRSFWKLIMVSFVLFIPISVLLYLQALPIAAITFKHGKYSVEALIGTADVFAYYCLGYWAFMLRSTFIRYYSARENIAIIRQIALLDISAHTVSALMLVPILGIGGIGIASSFGYVASLGLAIWHCRPHRAMYTIAHSDD
jgi:putative peptidoglycan lipid II flippase